ncbi:MAG: glycosyltransferase family 2 protein [Solirubrobacteraceae bacterium]
MSSPFTGLPVVWVVPLGIGLAVVALMLLWTALLFVRGQRARTHAPPAPADGADRFTWVFLVPALNEQVTIRDSVNRLLALDVAHRRIVVIDDGSDDATTQILAELSHPDLVVLRRDPPRAREGKAAALNYAYRELDGLLAGVDRDTVIVVIVDADGRLRPSAPRYGAAHFADPSVGGVQALVRLYNRRRLLTWMQDVEFSVYGHLFQAGRDGWGTAGMGGNGQFNRLRALDELADDAGPWRDRMTEDQDLGLRLLAAGWEGRQELRAVVEQQGPATLRPLLRQRTRWSQGNLQAIGLTGEVWHAPLGRLPRIELLAYLLMPLWQGLVGIALVIAMALAVTGTTPFWDGGPRWQLLLIYLLTFAGTALGCIAARADQGPLGWLRGLVIAPARPGHRARLRVLQLVALAGPRALGPAPAHRTPRLGQDRTRAARNESADRAGACAERSSQRRTGAHLNGAAGPSVGPTAPASRSGRQQGLGSGPQRFPVWMRARCRTHLSPRHGRRPLGEPSGRFAQRMWLVLSAS